MAVAVVQKCTQVASTAVTATAIATVTNTPTIGNHIILIAGRGIDTSLITGVADSAGNTWQVDKTYAPGTLTTISIGLASCKVTSALTGGSSTITVTWAASGNRKNVYAIEVSGIDPTSWYGSSSAATEQTSAVTTRTTAGIAPATTGDLVMGSWVIPAVETGLAATSPHTAWPAGTAAGYFVNSSAISIDATYLVTTGAGSVTPAATVARSSTYLGFAAVYKQVAAAGAGFPFQTPLTSSSLYQR